MREIGTKGEGRMIKTDEPFLVNGKVKLRSTIDIEGNIGKIIRVGTMNDTTSEYDIGTFLSIDFKKGYLLIRSLKTDEVVAYDIDCTNSNILDDVRITNRRTPTILEIN
jgi:DNA helicase TIP49 (TBP-interacting protein)|tara:strand:+ start:609 stop:935 length:327 start_codon:yes stop_codon:yes gene_type:complete